MVSINGAGWISGSHCPVHFSIVLYRVFQVAIYSNNHAISHRIGPLSAGTPASLKVGWARAHLALILIIIIVVGAVAGSGTYYLYISSNRPTTVFFYEALAPNEAEFVQHQTIPKLERNK